LLPPSIVAPVMVPSVATSQLEVAIAKVSSFVLMVALPWKSRAVVESVVPLMVPPTANVPLMSVVVALMSRVVVVTSTSVSASISNWPSAEELKALLADLKLDARALMRTFEAPYKDNNLDDESLSEDDLIQAMIDHPILIERPIVKTDKGVAIGRPPENILAIL